MPADPDNPLAVLGETLGSLLGRVVLYLSAIVGGLSLGASIAMGRYMGTDEVFKLLAMLDLGTFFLHGGGFLIHPLGLTLMFFYIRYEWTHLTLIVPLAGYGWLGYSLLQLIEEQRRLGFLLSPP
ncbi:MAG: hypothetical protein RML49_02495 [Verrucomicrobiae bacterium]|nr:hypothetical protein [Verrucomicrobiae bacterium]